MSIINENDINEKKKNRSDKKKYYLDEREKIISKLIKLSNLDNENSALYIQLKNNSELKNELKNMILQIKKCYRCSSWGYFVCLKKGVNCDEITLLKAIFKDHGYKIFSKDIVTEYNNEKKRYTKIYFNK